MFREMRRKNQVLSLKENIQILDRGTSGVLAVSGDDDYPYAVPLSYVYYDNKIFFHCGKAGHKLDAIAKNEKVSFCVIDKDEIIQNTYTSHFRSVIAFGKARILEEEGEKRAAIEILTEKYSPDMGKTHQLQTIDGGFNNLCMIELTIDHLSGKEAMELAKRKLTENQ